MQYHSSGTDTVSVREPGTAAGFISVHQKHDKNPHIVGRAGPGGLVRERDTKGSARRRQEGGKVLAPRLDSFPWFQVSSLLFSSM